jgi:hypothetical protein
MERPRYPLKTMVRHGSKLLLGATLFANPQTSNDHYWPGLLGVVMVLLVVVPPLVLYVRAARPGPPNSDDNDDGGGGGSEPPPGPSDRPPGGIPLDDALPARIRLRGPARLADQRARRARRPAREPDRAPARETTPS